MNYQVTVGQIVQFILSNRKDKIMKNFSEEDVTFQVVYAISENKLFYNLDREYNVNGVAILGDIDRSKVFVYALLCTSKEALNNFVRKFKELFPEHTIHARRKRKPVDYGQRTNRLCKTLIYNSK